MMASVVYQEGQPVVSAPAGRIVGRVGDGLLSFLDIPYALPPTEERRFRPPVRQPHWTEPLDAGSSGLSPPQRPQPPLPGLDLDAILAPNRPTGDDCLRLNVRRTAESHNAPLPVMVYVFGGAWTIGSKDARAYAGSAFARSGVVYVAINYRVGVEGFIPIDSGATNLGLRDQILALEWVRDNITAFGGDPGNVTVFGESAGAACLAALITSPLARGLFHRAILQSGNADMAMPLEVGCRLTAEFARVAGVLPDLNGFRSLTVHRWLDVLEQVQSPDYDLDMRDACGRDPLYGLFKLRPVYGDDVLPLAPAEALTQGAGAEIEVLIGTDTEEMALFLVPTGATTGLTEASAYALLARSDPRGAEALAAHGLGRPGRHAGTVFEHALTDLMFRQPAERFAAAHRGRTHLYSFEWRSPLLEGRLGACHCVELPFVFNDLASHAGLIGSDPPQALADIIHATWVRFGIDGFLPWHPYGDANSPPFVFGGRVDMADAEMLSKGVTHDFSRI